MFGRPLLITLFAVVQPNRIPPLTTANPVHTFNIQGFDFKVTYTGSSPHRFIVDFPPSLLTGDRYQLCGERYSLCGDKFIACGDKFVLCGDKFTLCT